MTKVEKNKLYRFLLKRLKVSRKNAIELNVFLWGGMCSDITYFYSKRELKRTIEDFPELMAQKHEVTYKGGKLWYRNDTIKGIDSRINSVKAAIALLAPKKRNK